MKKLWIVLLVLLCAAASFVTAKYAVQDRAALTDAHRESAYERVMKTGTLRCAYILYPQFFDRDPNTGAFTGIDVDLMDEVGRQLSLKIVWAEEVGLTNAFEGLKIGRYDAICSALMNVPARYRVSAFTAPYAFFPYNMYVRVDDKRFDNDFSKANDPAVRIAYLEGELGQFVKQQNFPKATSVSLQNLTGFSEVPQQVASGKADIAMGEPHEIEAFMAKNPGKIRQVVGPPIMVEGGAMQVAPDEYALRDMLSGTLSYLQNTGYLAQTLEKHLGKPGHYYFLPHNSWELTPKAL